MKAERIVLDTNVLISAALIATGTPAKLLRALRDSSAILIFSAETQDELASRLRKRKFERYLSVSSRERFLARLDAVSETVFIANSPMGCRDRDDDKFLETAMVGSAACLVSGDSDLLMLHPFQGIPIRSPFEALTWLTS